MSEPSASRPDIIFLDMLMPEMDGIETAQALLGIGSLQGVKLVAASAAVCAHEQAHYAESGFHDVLTKPIVCERLYGMLGALLGVRFEYSQAVDAAGSDAADLSSNEQAIAEAARLSPAWRERLRSAAELCGITELRRCADELDAMRPPANQLARRVRSCLQTYDTLPLLELLAAVPLADEDVEPSEEVVTPGARR